MDVSVNGYEDIGCISCEMSATGTWYLALSACLVTNVGLLQRSGLPLVCELLLRRRMFLFGYVLWNRYIFWVTQWCSGRALDSWSSGHGFDSDRDIIRATTLGELFTPNVPLFTKQYNLVPCEPARAFMLKAPYCWQRHRVHWTRGYCGAVLRWSSDCIEPRYKLSALPFILNTSSMCTVTVLRLCLIVKFCHNDVIRFRSVCI